MSYTASTAKLVGAFQANNGKIMYVLFEETYESNLHPRRQHWGCRMIGDLESCMRLIFRGAAAAEGGSLRGAGGRDITPEGYIAGWMKELENPVQLNDRTFELFADDSFSAPVPKDLFHWTKERLASIGREVVAQALENGERLTVSLYEDADLLAAIYDGLHIGAWRILKEYDTPRYGERNESLCYKPAKSKVYTMDTPRFMRVREGHFHIARQDEKGDWRSDSSHCFMNSFITNLWRDELREPMTYRAKIKAFRDAIKGAQVMPSNAKLVVDTTVELERYQQDSVEWVLSNTPHKRIGTEIHIELPSDYNQLYRVATLHEKCAKFVFSDSAPTQQLDLLAC